MIGLGSDKNKSAAGGVGLAVLEGQGYDNSDAASKQGRPSGVHAANV